MNAGIVRPKCRTRSVDRCRRASPGVDLGDDAGHPDGFGQVVIHAGRQAVLAFLVQRAGRQPDDQTPAVAAFRSRTDALGCLDAVHDRHVPVHEDDVIGRFGATLHRLVAVLGEVDRAAGALQEGAYDFPAGADVVDQQHDGPAR